VFLQAYQKGRSWLASNIRAMADPKDPMRADQLEEQAKVVRFQKLKIFKIKNAFSVKLF
jgi:hypothetical protein